VLLENFGERLLFPADFVGRGDMSRGGLLLRCAVDRTELDYIPVAGAVRKGKRPPKLEPRRYTTRVRSSSQCAASRRPCRMEAKSVDEIPTGDDWQYEPKWDGFRCVAFATATRFICNRKPASRSRATSRCRGGTREVSAKRFVIDGELVIPVDGALSFDELQLRLHPAASRVQKLAAAHPAMMVVFDLLADEQGASLLSLPLRDTSRAAGAVRRQTPETATTPSASRPPRRISRRRKSGSTKSAAISMA
jgi:hypothetical protein